MGTQTARYKGRRLAAALAFSALAATGGIAVGAGPAAATTAPSINECLVFKPVLKEGVANQAGCTAAVQKYLRKYYYPAPAVDGAFGPETTFYVMRYQERTGLTGNQIDGKVGPVTWGEIADDCKARNDCDYHAEY